MMMLDKRAVDMLLALDDRQLTAVIQRIARDAGIDPGLLNADPARIAGIRAALSMATDSDLQRAGELIKSYKDGKKNS